MENPQEFYRGNGAMTAHRENFTSTLPKDLGALCEVVQGLLMHGDIAPFLYQLNFSEDQRRHMHIRPVAEMLSRIRAIDPKPLTIAREPSNRMPTICRHFSLMLCAILREQGVPARARCGFGAYFTPGKFEDHWVCEYWNASQARWVMVDAQLDAIQRNALHIDFDPVDVPRDRFIIAGDAWQQCRAGRTEASRFGLTHVGMSGLWFVAGNVVRDLASLNRMEMLPWDVWGLMEMTDAALTEERKVLLDKISALTLGGDEAFTEMRALYESDDRLQVPPVVFNAVRNAPENIANL